MPDPHNRRHRASGRQPGSDPQPAPAVPSGSSPAVGHGPVLRLIAEGSATRTPIQNSGAPPIGAERLATPAGVAEELLRIVFGQVGADGADGFDVGTAADGVLEDVGAAASVGVPQPRSA